MISINKMIEQLDGLRDTKDLSDWENKFVTSILEQYLLANKQTTGLSGKQLDKIESIWEKHFAG